MPVRTKTQVESTTLTATECAVLGLLTRGAAYGADIQDVRALPVRPSALTGRAA
jgi:hypothetical protein